MAFLLLLISILFVVIFSFFSASQNSLESLIWFQENSFFPLIFWGLGCFWFLYFFCMRGAEKQREASQIDFRQLQKVLFWLLKRNLYFIAFWLFYLGLYFILGPVLAYNFWYFICIVSIFILFAFFLSERFILFRDLIKINTVLFSLYYIFWYIYILLTWDNYFSWVDLLNQILIVIFFVLNVYYDTALLQEKIYDGVVVWYAIIYTFLFIIFYSSQANFWVLNSLIYIWFWASLLLRNIVHLSFFKSNYHIIKVFSILMWYLSLLSAMLYFSIEGFQIIIAGVISYLSIDTLTTHIKYQNYSSFVLWCLGIIFMYFYFYFSFLNNYEIGWYIFIIYSYFLYFFAILLWYIQRFRYPKDILFLYSIFYISSLITMAYSLLIFSFELFDFWVMLLLQSLLTFMVYYKINKTKQHD